LTELMSTTPVLLVRAFFSQYSGAGHLFRTLAVVECALRDGWRVIVITDEVVNGLPLQHPQLQWHSLPAAKQTEMDDARCCLRLCQATLDVVSLVLVDHYHLGRDWEATVEDVAPVAAIDDLCRTHFSSAWLIDYFPGRRYSDYVHPQTLQLLGLKYLLLRSGFRCASSAVMDSENKHQLNILLQFGGADVEQFPLPVLRALHNMPELKGNICWLQGDIALLDFWQRDDLTVQVTSRCLDMPALYRKNTIAIGAAGVAMWERTAIGLPSFVWQVAENQHDNFVVAKGYSLIHCCDIAPAEPERWRESFLSWLENSEPASQPGIDVFGANRVWQKICPEAFSLQQRVMFKPYSEADIDALFRLQQLPAIRQFSRNPEPLTWQEHLGWSGRLLASDQEQGWLMIAPTGAAIGWLKLNEADEKKYREISLLIDPEYQAMGLGKCILNFAKTQHDCLKAYVETANTASNRLFRQCDFHQEQNWFYWCLNCGGTQ
jgi:UDP-2,4-diacetamido-2,4,6-trideoxy-beta-L-altropyranose hydrolase